MDKCIAQVHIAPADNKRRWKSPKHESIAGHYDMTHAMLSVQNPVSSSTIDHSDSH
jgi:hypothetical protein